METTQKPQEQRRPHPTAADEKQRSRPTAERPREEQRSQEAGREARRRQPRKPEQAKAAQPGRGAAKAAPKDEKKPASQKPQPVRKPAQKKRPAQQDDIPNRKRSYGKSKPKKKSPVVSVIENLEAAAKQRAEKRKKGSGNRPQQNTPAVIYTQPAAFNRNRLVIQLITVAAVVLALVIGLSVFFKVEHIYVSGAKVYSESSITDVCGISKGDNLLTFSHARAAALIQANRPYVREVRFGIKLPDTVNIIIEEDDVVYGIKDQTGQWWLMNSQGRVVEQGNSAKVANNTQILGVALDNPVPNERAVALESAPAAADPTGSAEEAAQGGTVPSSVPVTTTGAQRLTATLQILKALEDNDIVGSAASVDVSRIDDIILWYGTRYQVNLGDSTRLEYKIACMNTVIAKMSEYQSGILDCSFTIWPNQVGYTPFA